MPIVLRIVPPVKATVAMFCILPLVDIAKGSLEWCCNIVVIVHLNLIIERHRVLADTNFTVEAQMTFHTVKVDGRCLNRPIGFLIFINQTEITSQIFADFSAAVKGLN